MIICRVPLEFNFSIKASLKFQTVTCDLNLSRMESREVVNKTSKNSLVSEFYQSASTICILKKQDYELG